MYMIASHIPVVVDAGRHLLPQDWHASLTNFASHFGKEFSDIVVLSPQQPRTDEQELSEFRVVTDSDGFRVEPSFDARCRTRSFWFGPRSRWVQDINRLLSQARIVHCGIDDLRRPMEFQAFLSAVRRNIPTVFVGTDMDLWTCWREALATDPIGHRLWKHAYVRCFDRCHRYGVRRGSLSLLKEGAVFDRYAEYARNAKSFCHTMHRKSDVISVDELRARQLTELDRPLRLVYCGRLIERKGVLESIAVFDCASRVLGADITYEIIGEGPDRAHLEREVSDRQLADRITFRGSIPYGPQLHQELRRFDALLFTPSVEDTPRMIFDCYAAGLPTLGYAIPYLLVRHKYDDASLTVSQGSRDQLASSLDWLSRDRKALWRLQGKARFAGEHHTMENWYSRRLEWTLEALALHRREVQVK